jgi:ATP-binding cassette subfamily B protein
MVLIALVAYELTARPDGVIGAIPVLGALALGAQRLLPILQQSYANWTLMRGRQESLVGVLELLEQPLPGYLDSPSVARVDFQKVIKLSRVGFRYSEDGSWVLSPGLDITIPKGGVVGIIGATGSGKSTMLDIFMGLLPPTVGTLEVDGVVVTEDSNRGWQSRLAHVPQTIFLADTTIAQNIAFGVALHEIDHDLVKKVAKKAQISDAIESWTLQYATLVGERGVRLSGGQRQRIGIARALYKQADVIVLDEATSALDNKTEVAVMQALKTLGSDLTVILVAHRLTTLQNCSKIYELKDGRVNRAGSYQEIVLENVNDTNNKGSL